jgi:hypothetical protein
MPIDATSVSPLSADEYRELRATIRERGTLRHLVTLITFSVWAATMLWSASVFGVPTFLLIPLLVLAAGFEVGFALHVGVERIGRYIQVRYEGESATFVCWEKTAMALRVPGGGVDPLFLRLYLFAAILNLLLGVWTASGTLLPAEDARVLVELAIFGLLHVAAVVRWLGAARFARSQRAEELRSFEQILRS